MKIAKNILMVAVLVTAAGISLLADQQFQIMFRGEELKFDVAPRHTGENMDVTVATDQFGRHYYLVGKVKGFRQKAGEPKEDLKPDEVQKIIDAIHNPIA